MHVDNRQQAHMEVKDEHAKEEREGRRKAVWESHNMCKSRGGVD